MRTPAALTLLVSLTGICYAEDWAAVHKRGLDAATRKDYGTAAQLLRKSAESAQNPREHAVSQNDLGIVQHQAGRDADARDALQSALNDWKKFPEEGNRYAQTAGALGTVKRMLGEYADAEALLRETLARPDLKDGTKSYLLATLGDILREQGRFEEARPILEKASTLDGSSWRQRINTTIALAELDRDAKNWDESEREWNLAADLARQHGYRAGEGACTRGLGQTWLERKNLARAEPLLRGALALFEGQETPDAAQVAVTLTSLGELYLAEQKTAMAEEALGRALTMDERTLGPAHPQVALVLEDLAQSFAIRNQADLARNDLERADRIMADRFGERSAIRAGVLANWGMVERRLNQPDRAAAQFRKALDTLGPNPADAVSLRSSIVNQYAQLLKETHHKREADELLAGTKAYR